MRKALVMLAVGVVALASCIGDAANTTQPSSGVPTKATAPVVSTSSAPPVSGDLRPDDPVLVATSVGGYQSVGGSIVMVWADGTYQGYVIDGRGAIDDPVTFERLAEVLPHVDGHMELELATELVAAIAHGGLLELAAEVGQSCRGPLGVATTTVHVRDSTGRSVPIDWCVRRDFEHDPIVAGAEAVVAEFWSDAGYAWRTREAFPQLRVSAALRHGGALVSGFVQAAPGGGRLFTAVEALIGEDPTEGTPTVLNLGDLSLRESAELDRQQVELWVVFESDLRVRAAGVVDDGQLVDTGPSSSLLRLGHWARLADSTGGIYEDMTRCNIGAGFVPVPSRDGQFTENFLAWARSVSAERERYRAWLEREAGDALTKPPVFRVHIVGGDDQNDYLFVDASGRYLRSWRVDEGTTDEGFVARSLRPAVGTSVAVYAVERAVLVHCEDRDQLARAAVARGVLVLEIPYDALADRPTIDLNSAAVVTGTRP